MKKIRLNVADLDATEILSRDLLKAIFGGSGSGSEYNEYGAYVGGDRQGSSGGCGTMSTSHRWVVDRCIQTTTTDLSGCAGTTTSSTSYDTTVANSICGH